MCECARVCVCVCVCVCVSVASWTLWLPLLFFTPDSLATGRLCQRLQLRQQLGSNGGELRLQREGEREAA